MYKSSINSLYVINSIDQLLKKKTPLKPYDTVFIAVSGGQDSICLLFFFFQLQVEWEIYLQIVWCNHLWQFDTFYTMREVVKVAFLLQIPFLGLVSSQNLTLEKASREWRYKSLQRLLYFYHSANLLTGHTASDKIETVLFNLLKGSGSAGINMLKGTKILIKESTNRKKLTGDKIFKLVYRAGPFLRNRELGFFYKKEDSFIKLNCSYPNFQEKLHQFSSIKSFKMTKSRSPSPANNRFFRFSILRVQWLWNFKEPPFVGILVVSNQRIETLRFELELKPKKPSLF
uniref:tRNA(Ile)-lysidine synthetase n=1 Tax=Xylochloris irregularis TaxID=480381 RepID=A0A097KMG5_9CHLO|nr:hypothetical chloroplast RF62 [Xylochloris irregularis]AIT94360.1 hypothetical chloroplast RF62 [Xylochloris irregularis]